MSRAGTLDPSQALACLSRRVQDDPLYRALAELATQRGVAVHVVGGTVRDALLGRGWHDLDVALDASQVAPLARALAEDTAATLVPLDDRLPTLRVVAEGTGGRREVDLSGLRGPDLEADLRARDLTVNALAVPLAPLAAGGPVAVVDPTGGLADLAHRTLRLPAPEVLADDPLRALRAHRFAATLGFELAPETRAAIRANAPLLAGMAVERVTAELMALASAPTGGAALTRLWEDGLLALIVPEVAVMDGVTQNTFHHLDVLAHTLAACREVDVLRAAPERFYGEHGARVGEYLATGDRGALVLLAVLLHDVAKPATRFVDAKGVHFHRHESLGAEMTGAIAERLRLSNAQTALLVSWVAQHLALKDLIGLHRAGSLPERTVRRFLRRAGEDLIGLVCVVLADTHATRGPDFPADGERLLLEVSRHLLTQDAALRADPRAGQPLLRGRDLIESLGLSPGPALGRVLAAVEDARLDGEVHDRDQALEWVKRWLETRSAPPEG
ncbi:MAG: HD domain-containing protein [bacterium]